MREFWYGPTIRHRWRRIQISALELSGELAPNVRMGDLAPEVNNFIYRCLRDLWEAESWDRITLPDGSVAISKREVFGWFTPAREVLFEDLQLPARPAVTPNKIAESLRKHLDSSPRRSGRGKT